MAEEKKLTIKQRLFIKEYSLDRNATQAAIRAGYSKKTAKEQGYQLINKQHVYKYLNLNKLPTTLYRQPDKRIDFVYLIHCEGTCFYKIGKTKSIENRIKIMQTGNPLHLQLITKVNNSKKEDIEIKLHKRFKEYRVRGEWFKFDEITLKEVMRIYELLSAPTINNTQQQ